MRSSQDHNRLSLILITRWVREGISVGYSQKSRHSVLSVHVSPSPSLTDDIHTPEPWRGFRCCGQRQSGANPDW